MFGQPFLKITKKGERYIEEVSVLLNMRKEYALAFCLDKIIQLAKEEMKGNEIFIKKGDKHEKVSLINKSGKDEFKDSEY